jgi:hypothetical protein
MFAPIFRIKKRVSRNDLYKQVSKIILRKNMSLIVCRQKFSNGLDFALFMRTFSVS